MEALPAEGGSPRGRRGWREVLLLFAAAFAATIVAGVAFAAPVAAPVAAPAAARVVCGDTVGPGGTVVVDRDLVSCGGPAPALTVIGPVEVDRDCIR